MPREATWAPERLSRPWGRGVGKKEEEREGKTEGKREAERETQSAGPCEPTS